MGLLEDLRYVNPLIKMLNDDSPGVRKEAVKALERINDPRAAKALMDLKKR